MTTTIAPTSVPDRELLAMLENAFAAHAGADMRIDASELQKALGPRSEYLAQRVLQCLDRDGNGVLTRDEFMAGVRTLVFGSDRDKLYFAFRVHDENGDGYIDRQELLRMIAISMAEAEILERSSTPETLTDAVFARAFGFCIQFDGALILFPVMRRLMTWVRTTGAKRIFACRRRHRFSSPRRPLARRARRPSRERSRPRIRLRARHAASRAALPHRARRDRRGARDRHARDVARRAVFHSKDAPIRALLRDAPPVLRVVRARDRPRAALGPLVWRPRPRPARRARPPFSAAPCADAHRRPRSAPLRRHAGRSGSPQRL